MNTVFPIANGGLCATVAAAKAAGLYYYGSIFVSVNPEFTERIHYATAHSHPTPLDIYIHSLFLSFVLTRF